jgi:hypothetical protein
MEMTIDGMNGWVVRTNSFRDHTSGGDRLAPAALDQVVSSAGYKREFSLAFSPCLPSHRTCWPFKSVLQILGRITVVRVGVMDDFEPWREFVASALQRDPEYAIVGYASDGPTAIREC